jgi:hypothetical protein
MKNSLHIYEEILLLAFRDKEGTIVSSVQYQYAIAGAILAELLLLKRIMFDRSAKKNYINLIDTSSTGDDLLDESIEKIKKAKRRARIETWVYRFSNIKKLKHRAAGKLCRRGILKEEEGKILLLFKRKIYPEINPLPEKKIIERVRKVVTNKNDQIDPRTIILLSIVKNVNLTKTIFSKEELKTYKKRINQIVNGEITGKATREAIQAMQAAIMVTCIMPAIASTKIN